MTIYVYQDVVRRVAIQSGAAIHLEHYVDPMMIVVVPTIYVIGLENIARSCIDDGIQLFNIYIH
jgi:hypothetical protein